MCGISGIIFKEGSTQDFNILVSMGQHQTMRGPDATGTWIEGNAGFMHNRLSIIDVSKAGNQPMETDEWVLIYNGEIYNYRELQSKIPVRAWKSYNDAETLLFLIDEYGVEETLEMIEGMFAFAAYNKSTRDLWLAVDPIGIKPLYFFSNPEIFAFASTPGALSNCQSKWEFDYSALIDYLALGGTRESFFKGIKKVMPGCLMKRSENGTTGFKKWYQPRKYENYTEEDLLQAVRDAIQSVKNSDVPVSVFLSGGIDSTVIATGCQFMKAIHLNSPELPYAKTAARKYNMELEVINPTDYSAKDCLEDYSRKSGDCSMASIIPYIVSEEVSKNCKVAISANGADELFFGYDRMSSDKLTPQQIRHIFRVRFFSSSNWSIMQPDLSSRDLELLTYVPFDLNKTLDFASMCHGLEVRVPFLNRTVIDMALSIPFKNHVVNGRRKNILKSFLEKEGFSGEYIYRPKLGFSLHQEPKDYDLLKQKGVNLLENSFGIPSEIMNGRDTKYYESCAGAFYCWYNVWREKMLFNDTIPAIA